MNGVYYNRERNEMIFTQAGDACDNQFHSKGLEMLYGVNKPCQSCVHLVAYECKLFGPVCIKNSNSCEKYERR